ncbi:transcriptional regulator DEF1 isoform X2 [Drosophila obscura]|uniref:transcriptional regulator DEF1 isoform X2 n=1 Tax=Drosophila obscura TaxID=7282 RepID=UPI001BB158E9|nr:transcriptional regulator DEF1 isoform X2 [Drosophila obscura]
MVLRSGIIIPFQFRDTKKLLMIGVPEENRNLNIWDLKNVVRAAFGIYNFEFRNKKIGFNIPDELLLHYLAQRHDLTNFVIEISQALDDGHAKEMLSYEPSCSMAVLKQQQQQQQQQHHPLQHHVPLPQRSSESASHHTHDYVPTSQPNSPALGVCHEPVDSPLEQQANTSSSDHADSSQKLRLTQTYAERTPESLTQSIDPMDIIPKAESESEVDRIARASRFLARQEHHHQQQQQQQQHQQQQAAALQHALPAQQIFPNYTHSLPPMNAPNPSQQSPYTPGLMSRFRKRGERMSKDQKELYVKFFEDNPCMLSNHRRHDGLTEPLWAKLAHMLNSVPQGAVKNVEDWKQTFDAWRYRIFMYTRYNSKLSMSETSDPKNFKPLTATDQKAYAMWTSHKHIAPQDYEKMDLFVPLDEATTATNSYDY